METSIQRGDTQADGQIGYGPGHLSSIDSQQEAYLSSVASESNGDDQSGISTKIKAAEE